MEEGKQGGNPPSDQKATHNNQKPSGLGLGLGLGLGFTLGPGVWVTIDLFSKAILTKLYLE